MAALMSVCLGAAEDAAAQGSCGFVAPTVSARQITLAGGSAIWYLGRPHIVCDGGVRIQADTAVVYTAQSLSHLMGNVIFRDASRILEADEARYFSQQGRLQAQGHLLVRDTAQSSVVENGNLVYLRQTDFRPEEEMTFRTWTDGVRPTALLYMQPDEAQPAADSTGPTEEVETPLPAPTPALRDSSGISMAPPDTIGAAVSPPEEPAAGEAVAPEGEAEGPAALPAEPDTVPWRVTGDEIFLQGDSYFRSTGDVVIERDSIEAYGQVAEYDQVAGRILIEEEARVVSSAYELDGRVVHIGMENGAMREIRALRDGVLTGDDLLLTAPMIVLFLDGGAMERLVAVPMEPDPDSVAAGLPVDSTLLARPEALAEDFSITADSLDVRAPGDILERIIAVGAARSESRARDSLNVEALPAVARSDWLEGDTVIATFVQVQVVDTSSASGSRTDYRLQQLEAKSGARSLYRLEPKDTTRKAGVDPPAVHYVVGEQILIVLEDGEVDHMDVQGQTRGFHLEPLRAQGDSLALDSLALDTLALDSLALDSAAVSDTVRPDTSVVRRLRAPQPPSWVPGADEGARRPVRPDPFTRSRRPW